jgi:hypothetical protein
MLGYTDLSTILQPGAKALSLVGPASCRSFVTPDSDPGSSLSRASRDRVHGNNGGTRSPNAYPHFK